MVCPFLVLHSHYPCVFSAVVKFPRNETEIAGKVIGLVVILMVALKVLPIINGIERGAYKPMDVRVLVSFVSVDMDCHIPSLFVEGLSQFVPINIYLAIGLHRYLHSFPVHCCCLDFHFVLPICCFVVRNSEP